MARRIISLDEKINKAQADVVSAKAKYDQAVNTLEKLLTKKQELDNKKLIEAFTESNKSLEEVIEFLQKNDSEND